MAPSLQSLPLFPLGNLPLTQCLASSNDVLTEWFSGPRVRMWGLESGKQEERATTRWQGLRHGQALRAGSQAEAVGVPGGSRRHGIAAR